MISNYLNKRFSLRNLTDEQFDSIVDRLAEELSCINYLHNYDDDILMKDWDSLLKYKVCATDTNSTVRTGMKLCEHFFPNFFKIKNKKGKNFDECITKESLIKVLRWNRKSHSTPYLSEIRRGVYFTQGLTKNTMYRPHLAKTIAFGLSKSVVLDPCAGWGGRMLGTLAAGKKYIGFEPNGETYENLKRLLSFINCENNALLINDAVENIEKYDFENVDVILTSPPYFNLEIYSDGSLQSENKHQTYQEWCDKWLSDIIKKTISRMQNDGYSCWNGQNIGKIKLLDNIINIHNDIGFEINKEYGIVSSMRQANQKEKEVKRRKELTIAFKRTL